MKKKKKRTTFNITNKTRKLNKNTDIYVTKFFINVFLWCLVHHFDSPEDGDIF